MKTITPAAARIAKSTILLRVCGDAVTLKVRGTMPSGSMIVSAVANAVMAKSSSFTAVSRGPETLWIDLADHAQFVNAWRRRHVQGFSDRQRPAGLRLDVLG